MDRRADRQTDERKDGHEISHLFYRTSSPLGLLPEKEKKEGRRKEIKKERKKERKKEAEKRTKNETSLWTSPSF